MSFATDILTVLTSDPSLNEMVNGGIYCDHLIDNWIAEVEDNTIWIVYDFNKSNQTDCINIKNVYMSYTLNVVVIQKGSNSMIDTITDTLINNLNNYGSGNIIDIAFLSDGGGFNQQIGSYTNSLQFRSDYIE